jgi:hypothetical protein
MAFALCSYICIFEEGKDIPTKIQQSCDIMCVCERASERGRKKKKEEREREREKREGRGGERERETDRETDRERERERGRVSSNWIADSNPDVVIISVLYTNHAHKHLHFH